MIERYRKLKEEENRKEQLDKLIANNFGDDGMFTAKSNIPIGRYFVAGAYVFLATVSIPTGEAVKPGVNCTLVDLGEALNALNSSNV